MIKTHKTKTGWVIETTDQAHGCLVQGGVAGRKVLYKTNTLRLHGITYKEDPNNYINNNHITIAEWLVNSVPPDKIIRRGTLIS